MSTYRYNVSIAVCTFQIVDNLPCIAFSGDRMPTANLCNGSMTLFSDTANFLPGENVTITCSIPTFQVVWSSPLFSETPVVLSNVLGTTTATRLDGAIAFNLTNVITGPPPCATATATIANIQEPMQGLSLACSDGENVATVVIDVVGKLHVVPKIVIWLYEVVY